MRSIILLIVSAILLVTSILEIVSGTRSFSDPQTIFWGVLSCFAFMGIVQAFMWLIVSFGLPKPKSEQSPISKDNLENAILALENESSPFQVKRVGERLVCSWKIVDTKWFEFFSKVNLREDYKLHLKLTSGNKVLAIETTSVYRTSFGSKFNFSFGYSRGWSPFRYKGGVAYGIKELFPLTLGNIYKYQFSPNMFRGPILKMIIDSGWKIQPCTLSLTLGI